MRNLLFVPLICLVASSAIADDSKKAEAFENRIQQLEKRVAELEAFTAPIIAKQNKEKRINQQRLNARERMQKDSKAYSNEQLREIESLYQVANKQWRTQQGKQSLEKLVANFDKANRTGCALLYLGQMSKKQERENYLQRAIAGFSDCYYGDGVQVGAYARYYLAYHYKEKGMDKQAENLFKELATQYPDAIDHRGQLLADLMTQTKS
ncbi:MAG: hypothetical protein JKY95_01320 [Planctomycetaceae bacterium]|nr:hypothetical protein [Planctomycetaceae bacterium]